MKIETLIVEVNRSFNIGDYENVKVVTTVVGKPEAGESVEGAHERLIEQARVLWAKQATYDLELAERSRQWGGGLHGYVAWAKEYLAWILQRWQQKGAA